MNSAAIKHLSITENFGFQSFLTTKEEDTATSLIIIMVCVDTNKRPPIENRVSVMCNPTPPPPQPTWLMMSHQTKNILPINLFRPMMAMKSPPCWHRHLIWAVTIQSFKRKLQWLCPQPTSCDSYAMDWLKEHPLFTSNLYLPFHGQPSFLIFIVSSLYLLSPLFERRGRNQICYHHHNVAAVETVKYYIETLIRVSPSPPPST